MLDTLSAKLTDTLNNPKGFSPEQMAILKTSASDTIARQTNMAKIGAGAAIAQHGGADLGSGVSAQVLGSIEGEGMQSQSQADTGINLASEAQKNQNYWNSVKGLTDVAAAENPTGYASAANQSADATANLSHAVLASQQAGWQNTMGIISGVAGLGTGVVGGLNSAGFFGGTKAGG